MGITDHPAPAFVAALNEEFGIRAPTDPGLNAVAAIRAMHAGRVGVFIALGGNFAAATPDSGYTEAALERCRLTVQISTKLNRSHVIAGETALILPALGRTDRDEQAGLPQFVTCENSMGVVSPSRGTLTPVSGDMRSEVQIVAELAAAMFAADENEPALDWAGMAHDYARVRQHIERVVPGFEGFDARLAANGQIVLPHPVRDKRRFDTPTGKALFTVHPIPPPQSGEGCYVMTTIRSHDQFNTTVYADNDRYRGISGTRQVVFMNPGDVASAGFVPGDVVSLVSNFAGEERRVDGFRIVPYDIPAGCLATYYPESNGLIPLDHVAERSNTPAYKSVMVRLVPGSPVSG